VVVAGLGGLRSQAGPRDHRRDDIHATVDELRDKGVEFTRPIAEERWGLVTAISLPGGAELGLYEPRHPTPPR
jgi:hypothetical protein